MAESEQSAGRRLGVITVDQVVSGASNVLVTLLAAQLLDVSLFGLFGIVFMVYVLVQGTTRALVSQPLLVHPDEVSARPGDAVGAALAVGVYAGALVGLGSLGAWFVDGRLAAALLVLALALPLLSLQDAGRYLAIATGRPAFALVLDLTWLVLLVAALGVVVLLDARTLLWFVLSWAGTGALAGALVLGRHRGERIDLNHRWLRRTWDFSWRYMISFGTTQGSALAGTLALGGLAGAQALGAVRGAVFLMRPYVTFQLAAISGGVAEIAKTPQDRDSTRRHARRTTLLATGVAVLNGLVLVFLPDSVGRLILGDTWRHAEPLMLATAVQLVLLGLNSGARTALTGARMVRTSTRLDLALAPAVLVGAVVGALVGGAQGFVWATALVTAISVIAWWVPFGWYLRGRGEQPRVEVAAVSPDVR